MSPQVDFSASLRQAREARGISLRDIAETTKISMTALEGLEHGDVSRLPGGIFSRSFVRAYAQEVGLDPEATVREFSERFPDSVQPLRAHVVLEASPSGPSGGRGWHMLLAAFVLVAAAVSGLALIGWPRVPLLDPAVEEPPVIASAPLPMATPAPVTVPAAPELPAPAADGLAATPASSAAPLPPAATDVTAALAVPDTTSGALRLVMEPVAPCWVKVVADGAVVFARQMRAGEREVREAQGEILLTVGDAGAFNYSINDVRGRPLGSNGKVVTIRIHRANLTDFVAN